MGIQRRVIIESPFAGNGDRNLTYARAAMRDCIMHGEAPLAGHLLYTQPGILDDSVSWERELGITLGFDWGHLADAVIVYQDLGISPGMLKAIAHYRSVGTPIEYRNLKGWRAEDL